MRCELAAGLSDAEIDQVVNDVRNAIERLRDLPEDAEEPEGRERRGDVQGPVSAMALSGAVDLSLNSMIFLVLVRGITR